jgi:hypothetical protein
MIVDEIDVEGISVLEAKYDPPVAGHSDAPKSLKVAFERMEAKAMNAHILNPLGDIEARQDALDPADQVRPHATPVSPFVETLQATMPETYDHVSL